MTSRGYFFEPVCHCNLSINKQLSLSIGFTGYKKGKIDKLNEDLNPGLALITDWIIASGNTALSVDMLQSCLEQMSRDDIVEIIQKGQGM